jgi:carbon-monoxide dehydrogenase medium subunit
MRTAGPGEASAFKRVMRPQGVALPILGLAVWVRLEAGVIESVRIALGPAGPRPLRATRAEAFLSGRLFTPDLLPPVADLVLEEAWLRTSAHRATSEYRRELILPLLERALNLAVRRAATGQVTPEPAEEA